MFRLAKTTLNSVSTPTTLSIVLSVCSVLIFSGCNRQIEYTPAKVVALEDIKIQIGPAPDKNSSVASDDDET